MMQYPIRCDVVSLSVTRIGAQLSNVAFTLDDGRTIAPMHMAPWSDEDLLAGTTASLRVLRGDFLCAPFGASDVIAEEARAHGLPANGDWSVLSGRDDAVHLRLEGDVMGATVEARIALFPGHRVVYQSHSFIGGKGRLPIGHHAMLRAAPRLALGFGPWIWAGTPPEPVETPPAGRSVLAYRQEITDLHAACLPTMTAAKSSPPSTSPT